MKTFPISLDDALHKSIKLASVQSEKTIHEWIISAIKYELKNEGFEVNEKGTEYGNASKD
ncbi:MAG: hypothetical protein LBR47_06750 [Spirochaetaceae bacterium]|jgi:predicted HicB family RNase H-like nuclease|nr:hypothetical protein [Spirochaetaceae bacterium]